MRWIENAKCVAFQYKSNCRELQQLRYDDKPPVPVISGHSGRISKPVEDEVMRMFGRERLQYVLQAKQAVEFALAMVQRKHEGEITVRLFELVYRDGTHRLYGAALELNISERTAKRYNAYLLKMIAIRMGYMPIKEQDMYKVGTLSTI